MIYCHWLKILEKEWMLYNNKLVNKESNFKWKLWKVVEEFKIIIKSINKEISVIVIEISWEFKNIKIITILVINHKIW